MSKQICLCGDPTCDKDCDFSSRTKNSTDRKELYNKMLGVRETIIRSYLLEDWEHVEDLLCKLQDYQTEIAQSN